VHSPKPSWPGRTRPQTTSAALSEGERPWAGFFRQVGQTPDLPGARRWAARYHRPEVLNVCAASRETRPVVVRDQERVVLEARDDLQVLLFLTLILTGLRLGDLCHLLLPADLD
jgi:hypothetical protein